MRPGDDIHRIDLERAEPLKNSHDMLSRGFGTFRPRAGAEPLRGEGDAPCLCQSDRVPGQSSASLSG